MDEDLAFIRAIVVNPDEQDMRLIYADWLEEHGDPRGEYLRLECELASLSDEDSSSQEEPARLRMTQLRGCLKERRPALDAIWLAVMEEARRQWERGRFRCCKCRKRYALPEAVDISPVTQEKLLTRRYCRRCWENARSNQRRHQDHPSRSGHWRRSGWGSRIVEYDGYSHPQGHTNSWENTVRLLEDARSRFDDAWDE